MRKYIRNHMRYEARLLGVKQSKYVRKEFDEYQIKKRGALNRRINQAKGTLPKFKWRMPIAQVRNAFGAKGAKA